MGGLDSSERCRNKEHMQPLFHVYIDEAGDPGVKPKATDEPHWSDWFVLSAVVVGAENDADTVEWIKDMNRAIRRNGPSDIHYRKFSDANRRHVCRVLASKPVRLFIVASHKDTMRRHRSQRLGKSNDKQFYNWCLRLLLERVTEWCARRGRKMGAGVFPARLVFSHRGGHDYGELRGYLRRIIAQSLTGNLTLDRKGITPDVIFDDLIEVVPHDNLAGLQLADVAASAFWQAACSTSRRHDLTPASDLICRLARKGQRKRPDGFGMMLLPLPH
ncbi:MAG: hypothetical protein DI606_19965 [Sphingobium sp.]|uniref:DUF3800 domain-containing protein n=1 Tax=unclassified Sphingobium TaxID=2611147 RepID=UPI000B29DD8A|nr:MULTISPECIES: DUF3800 domain-containing protein [unclassified Sphingobium]PZU05286.1 MAG: hypothetical protein DI606_19965 [Sphingobium sp.]